MGGTVPKSFPQPGAVGQSQGATVVNPAQQAKKLTGPGGPALSAFYGMDSYAAPDGTTPPSTGGPGGDTDTVRQWGNSIMRDPNRTVWDKFSAFGNL